MKGWVFKPRVLSPCNQIGKVPSHATHCWRALVTARGRTVAYCTSHPGPSFLPFHVQRSHSHAFLLRFERNLCSRLTRWNVDGSVLPGQYVIFTVYPAFSRVLNNRGQKRAGGTGNSATQLTSDACLQLLTHSGGILSKMEMNNYSMVQNRY